LCKVYRVEYKKDLDIEICMLDIDSLYPRRESKREKARERERER
jgi:hypothetical protein